MCKKRRRKLHTQLTTTQPNDAAELALAQTERKQYNDATLRSRDLLKQDALHTWGALDVPRSVKQDAIEHEMNRMRLAVFFNDKLVDEDDDMDNYFAKDKIKFMSDPDVRVVHLNDANRRAWRALVAEFAATCRL